MIIKDSSGQMWQVRDCEDKEITHCWEGHQVKRGKSLAGNPTFVPTCKSRDMLVRKAGATVVQPF